MPFSQTVLRSELRMVLGMRGVSFTIDVAVALTALTIVITFSLVGRTMWMRSLRALSDVMSTAMSNEK